MTRHLCIVICLSIPGVSLAQPATSQEITDVRSNARGRVGPFYFTPGVELKELGIDSNVFNASGEQSSDFTATVAPRLNVWVPMARRALLKATMASDFVWYAEYASERSINPQVAARAEVFLSRITLFGERGYVNTRQRPNHEIDVRSRRTEETLTAGLQVAVSSALSVEVAGRRFDARHDGDAQFEGTSLQRTLNRATDSLQLTARHHLTPLTTIAVRYDVLRDEFEFSRARDSESYRVMPGVEFKPQALISGSAYLGYRKFTPAMPESLPAFSGLVGQLGLSYTLLGSTVLGMSFVRDLSYSYDEVRPFFVDTSVGASVRRALGPRFDVLLSADRHEYEYERAVDAPPIAPTGEREVDVTWNYAGSIGYRLGRDGRIGFGVSYWNRESTRDPRRAYENVRVFSTVSYGF